MPKPLFSLRLLDSSNTGSVCAMPNELPLAVLRKELGGRTLPARALSRFFVIREAVIRCVALLADPEAVDPCEACRLAGLPSFLIVKGVDFLFDLR